MGIPRAPNAFVAHYKHQKEIEGEAAHSYTDVWGCGALLVWGKLIQNLNTHFDVSVIPINVCDNVFLYMHVLHMVCGI